MGNNHSNDYRPDPTWADRICSDEKLRNGDGCAGEWYFGKISRRTAEEYLMGHINARGTFLIRESEQNPGGFALSIKDWENDRSYHIKHYKIKPLDNNRGYYITTRQTFQTLPDLVKSYQTTAGESDRPQENLTTHLMLGKGLCCQLSKACSRSAPSEADSTDLGRHFSPQPETDRRAF